MQVFVGENTNQRRAVKEYSGKLLRLICVIDEEGKVIRTIKKNSIEKHIDDMLSEKVKSVALFTPPEANHDRKVKAVAHLTVRF